MNDRVFDFLMVLLGAVAAKAIDEAVELVKREVEKRRDSDEGESRES